MAPSTQPMNVDQILSEAKKNFQRNMQDIKNLLDIHKEQEGEQHGKAGRRPESIQVLHRAAVVMLTACWEAYEEDLFRKASECLLASHRVRKSF